MLGAGAVLLEFCGGGGGGYLAGIRGFVSPSFDELSECRVRGFEGCCEVYEYLVEVSSLVMYRWAIVSCMWNTSDMRFPEHGATGHGVDERVDALGDGRVGEQHVGDGQRAIGCGIVELLEFVDAVGGGGEGLRVASVTPTFRASSINESILYTTVMGYLSSLNGPLTRQLAGR